MCVHICPYVYIIIMYICVLLCRLNVLVHHNYLTYCLYERLSHLINILLMMFVYVIQLCSYYHVSKTTYTIFRLHVLVQLHLYHAVMILKKRMMLTWLSLYNRNMCVYVYMYVCVCLHVYIIVYVYTHISIQILMYSPLKCTHQFTHTVYIQIKTHSHIVANTQHTHTIYT